jgi:hypothetical protein
MNFSTLNYQSIASSPTSYHQPEEDKAMVGGTRDATLDPAEPHGLLQEPIGGVPLPDYLQNPIHDISSTLFSNVNFRARPAEQPVIGGTLDSVESNRSLQEPIGGVPLPDYLQNTRNDIASKLFDNILIVPEHKGAGDIIDRSHTASGGITPAREIIQRGLTRHLAEPQIMGWMNLGIQMAEKAVAMVKAGDPRVLRVLSKYFSDSSPETKRAFVDYATKASATLQDQVQRRAAQIVVFSGTNYAAFVYQKDPHKRIFINEKAFNGQRDDPWLARLMLHEATHFAGADDHGYISDVGADGPHDKLNNADSLAYAMRELFELSGQDVSGIKPKPPVIQPEKPVQPEVDIPLKPAPPPQQQVDYRLWNNPLGGQQRVEVWNEVKDKQGGYKNGDFVVHQDTGYQRWLAPDGRLKWIEA